MVWRLTSSLGLSQGHTTWAIRGVAFLLAAAFPVSHILSRLSPNPFTLVLDWFTSIWMGVMVYLFLFSLVAHLAGAILQWTSQWNRVQGLVSVDPGRLGLVLVIVATMLVAGWGMYRARCKARLVDLEIPVESLPRDLDGFTIVHISDVHLGMIVSTSLLERIVDRANAMQPDLVVITGDLVDADPGRLESMTEPLGRLTPKHGTYAVTGNHEFYAGVDRVIEQASKAGIRFLRNEKATVADDILLYGMDDPTARRMGGSLPAMEEVIGEEARESPAILLVHQPRGLEQASKLGIDLMLAGHTHHGQLWPITLISRMIYPYQYGLYTRGKTRLYVTAGVGTWGPPMRIGAPHEIVRIRLRSGS